jgi:hypothetical protein
MTDDKLNEALGNNFDEIVAELAAIACAPIVQSKDALYALLLVCVGVSPTLDHMSSSIALRRRVIPTLPADELDLSNAQNNALRSATIDAAVEALLAYKLRLEAAAASAEKPQS